MVAIGTVVVEISLVCLVIKTDNLIKVSGDSKESLKVSRHLSKFGGHRHCSREDITAFNLSGDLTRRSNQGDV